MRLKLYKALKSWQIFHAIKEEFGKEYLFKLWGFRNARQIYNWCADPREIEGACPNPMDKLQLMLEDLNRIGRRDLALAALRCLARPLGFEVRDPKETVSDKEELALEFLDASTALGEVGRIIQEVLEDGVVDKAEVILIEDAVDKTIDELMQIKDAARKAREGR